MYEYKSPQEREAERRRKVAEEQEKERNLRDSTRKRETRYCNYHGCGMPFSAPPGSKRTRCLDHDGREV